MNWRMADENRLLDLLVEGATIPEIANDLGRSINSIKQKLRVVNDSLAYEAALSRTDRLRESNRLHLQDLSALSGSSRYPTLGISIADGGHRYFQSALITSLVGSPAALCAGG